MEGLWLAIIGLAAGLSGGLLGIGGSIVMIPAMTELLGAHQHLYQGSALIVTFFVAVPAVVQHIRAGAVSKPILVNLAPAAVLGSLAGVACSELSIFRAEGSIYLTGVFGLFLFCVAAREAWRLLVHDDSPEHTAALSDKQPLWLPATLVGAATGLVSGLLGVGGGLVAVPLQRRFLRLGLRNAIANSAALIVLLSVVGGTAKNLALATNHPEYTVAESVKLASFLIPTAMAGAWFGGRLTHILPLRVVRAAFLVLLMAAGYRMVHRSTLPAASSATQAMLQSIQGVYGTGAGAVQVAPESRPG